MKITDYVSYLEQLCASHDLSVHFTVVENNEVEATLPGGTPLRTKVRDPRNAILRDSASAWILWSALVDLDHSPAAQQTAVETAVKAVTGQSWSLQLLDTHGELSTWTMTNGSETLQPLTVNCLNECAGIFTAEIVAATFR